MGIKTMNCPLDKTIIAVAKVKKKIVSFDNFSLLIKIPKNKNSAPQYIKFINTFNSKSETSPIATPIIKRVNVDEDSFLKMLKFISDENIEINRIAIH